MFYKPLEEQVVLATEPTMKSLRRSAACSWNRRALGNGS